MILNLNEDWVMSIETITEKTVDWISISNQKGMDIIKWYLNGEISVITPIILDKVFNIWVNDTSDNKAPIDWVIDGLGVLFGEYIISKSFGKWVIEEDNDEKHLMILTKNNIKVYPIHSVSKRVNSIDKEIGFFSSIWDVIEIETRLQQIE